MEVLILKNNKQLVLPDLGKSFNAIRTRTLVFCTHAVKKMIGYALNGNNLAFFHLGNFSMKFSQDDKDHFADMWAQTIYIEGMMLDIILPINAALRSVVIKNVQSLTKTELLRNDALSETNIGKS